MFQFLKRISIRYKMYTLVLVSSLGILVTGFEGLNKTQILKDDLSHANVNMLTVYHLVSLDKDIYQALLKFKDIMELDPSSSEFKSGRAYISKQINTDVPKRWDYGFLKVATTLSSQELDLIEIFNNNYSEWKALIEDLTQSYAVGNVSEAGFQSKMARATGLVFTDMRSAINRLTAISMTESQAMMDAAEHRNRRTRALLISVMAVTLAISALLGWQLLKLLLLPLNQVIDGLRTISSGQGDLTLRLHVDSQDELSELVFCFNTFIHKMQIIVQDLKISAESIRNASRTVTGTSLDLAAGAEEQQNQLAEIAASMEEINRGILSMNESSEASMSSTSKANEVAMNGAKNVESMVAEIENSADTLKLAVAKIKQLEASSNTIGEIIGVIDDIADQTSLLALNANIEAARAGEAGRGFAVVADEVRKLAERTVKATSEIGSSITSIQSAVEHSVHAVENTSESYIKTQKLAISSGADINEINTSIKNLIETMNRVVTASMEQSEGITIVTQNIDAVSHVSIEASSAALDLSKSASELDRELAKLNDIVNQFKV